jgi:hypothetical protein
VASRGDNRGSVSLEVYESLAWATRSLQGSHPAVVTRARPLYFTCFSSSCQRGISGAAPVGTASKPSAHLGSELQQWDLFPL